MGLKPLWDSEICHLHKLLRKGIALHRPSKVSFLAFLVLALAILFTPLIILLLHAKGFRERLTQVIGVL